MKNWMGIKAQSLKSIALLAMGVSLVFSIGMSPLAQAAKKKKGGDHAAAEKASGATYLLAPAESSMEWSCGKVVINSAHRGTVGVKEGEVTFAGDKGALSKGHIVIDMTKIDNEDLKSSPEYHQKLLKHLHSADFFDTEKFKDAKFEIKNVKVISAVGTNGDGDYEVEGDLTIKGEKKPLTIKPLNITTMDTGKKLAKASFTINRTVWGIKYGSNDFFKDLADKAIKNEIDFKIRFVADMKK